MAAPSPSPQRLVRVLGAAQSYDWGRIGSKSAVAQLLSVGVEQLKVDEAKPYAELWLGTHSTAPSYCVPTEIKGDLEANKELLSKRLGTTLPFLFKVLSVGKALSIQAHPDAKRAKELHKERPKDYKDDQHKPELALAVTPFEALCAFRPLRQIADHALEYPEFVALLGADLAEELKSKAGGLAEDDTANDAARKDLLKRVFAKMMKPSSSDLQSNLEAMLARLKASGVSASVPVGESNQGRPDEADTTKKVQDEHVAKSLAVGPLMLRLAEQYPGDVGVFAPLYLNAFALQPGQAMFLGPNEPHAYLSGDCAECMACSDNVVRAGLTPKLRDTDVLLDMLTYESHTPNSALMQSRSIAGHDGTSLFAPPQEFTEFRLLRTVVPAGGKGSLPKLSGASIALTYSGEARASLQGDNGLPVRIAKGFSLLVPAGSTVTLDNHAGKEDLLVFQCAPNKD